MQAVSNVFFDLPEDEKRKILRPAPDVTRGYIPLEAESVGRSQGVDAPGDLNESLMIGPVDVSEDPYYTGPEAGRHFRSEFTGRGGRRRCGPPMKPISARWAGSPKT